MTTDKRAAAIAALKKAVQRYRDTEHGVRPGWVDSEVIRTAQEALAALEADDGRALLRLREWCSTVRADIGKRNIPEDRLYCAGVRGALADTIAEIDKLLASPEQPAPEPAAPHADDEAPRNLYHVQDPERGMHVLATSFQDAVDRWRARIAFENAMEPSEVDDPDGVALVAKGHKEFPEVLA